MNKRISLKPWRRSDLHEAGYNAFIAAVGYETRARFIAESLNPQAQQRFACAFDDNKVHSYFDNMKWYEGECYEIDESSDANFESWCQNVIAVTAKSTNGIVRLGIDISSMSRFRIAALTTALFAQNGGQSLIVDFLYAPSRFTPPAEEEEAPIMICKPVVDMLAGWSLEPEKPTLAIFGLGYECDKALGALEYIEPASVWAFKPSGEDPLYDAAMINANQAFCESVPSSQVFEYRVDQPLDCFSNLEALLYGKIGSSKPILVPFGPKMFALNCLLVACVYYPTVAVWRVSSGPYEPAVDRVANGKIVGIRVQFKALNETVKSTRNQD